MKHRPARGGARSIEIEGPRRGRRLVHLAEQLAAEGHLALVERFDVILQCVPADSVDVLRPEAACHHDRPAEQRGVTAIELLRGAVDELLDALAVVQVGAADVLDRSLDASERVEERAPHLLGDAEVLGDQVLHRFAILLGRFDLGCHDYPFQSMLRSISPKKSLVDIIAKKH